MKPNTGIQRIAAAFHAAQAEGRAALMPYYTLGFPNPEAALEVTAAIAAAGADLIELGVPFSDPLADGPTIQRSTQTALAAGMTVRGCLEGVRRLREAGVTQPLLLMGYINPILAYGLAQFTAASAEAGADGLIVPDLPLEEAGELENACERQGLALVYLVAPTTPPERLALAAARTRGFLYLVSLTGVTGARQTLPPGLEEFVARAREVAETPLAVGFGISTPEQARAVGKFAGGVIVGSALIQAVAGAAEPVRAAREFVTGLREALERAPA